MAETFSEFLAGFIESSSSSASNIITEPTVDSIVNLFHQYLKDSESSLFVNEIFEVDHYVFAVLNKLLKIDACAASSAVHRWFLAASNLLNDTTIKSVISRHSTADATSNMFLKFASFWVGASAQSLFSLVMCNLIVGNMDEVGKRIVDTIRMNEEQIAYLNSTHGAKLDDNSSKGVRMSLLKSMLELHSILYLFQLHLDESLLYDQNNLKQQQKKKFKHIEIAFVPSYSSSYQKTEDIHETVATAVYEAQLTLYLNTLRFLDCHRYLFPLISLNIRNIIVSVCQNCRLDVVHCVTKHLRDCQQQQTSYAEEEKRQYLEATSASTRPITIPDMYELKQQQQQQQQLQLSQNQSMVDSSNSNNNHHYIPSDDEGSLYLNRIGRDQCNKLLLAKVPGTFVVRPHETAANQFFLSFKSNQNDEVKHAIIRREVIVVDVDSGSTKYAYQCGKLGPYSTLFEQLKEISKILSCPLIFTPLYIDETTGHEIIISPVIDYVSIDMNIGIWQALRNRMPIFLETVTIEQSIKREEYYLQSKNDIMRSLRKDIKLTKQQTGYKLSNSTKPVAVARADSKTSFVSGDTAITSDNNHNNNISSSKQSIATAENNFLEVASNDNDNDSNGDSASDNIDNRLNRDTTNNEMLGQHHVCDNDDDEGMQSSTSNHCYNKELAACQDWCIIKNSHYMYTIVNQLVFYLTTKEYVSFTLSSSSAYLVSILDKLYIDDLIRSLKQQGSKSGVLREVFGDDGDTDSKKISGGYYDHMNNITGMLHDGASSATEDAVNEFLSTHIRVSSLVLGVSRYFELLATLEKTLQNALLPLPPSILSPSGGSSSSVYYVPTPYPYPAEYYNNNNSGDTSSLPLIVTADEEFPPEYEFLLAEALMTLIFKTLSHKHVRLPGHGNGYGVTEHVAEYCVEMNEFTLLLQKWRQIAINYRNTKTQQLMKSNSNKLKIISNNEANKSNASSVTSFSNLGSDMNQNRNSNNNMKTTAVPHSPKSPFGKISQDSSTDGSSSNSLHDDDNSSSNNAASKLTNALKSKMKNLSLHLPAKFPHVGHNNHSNSTKDLQQVHNNKSANNQNSSSSVASSTSVNLNNSNKLTSSAKKQSSNSSNNSNSNNQKSIKALAKLIHDLYRRIDSILSISDTIIDTTHAVTATNDKSKLDNKDGSNNNNNTVHYGAAQKYIQWLFALKMIREVTKPAEHAFAAQQTYFKYVDPYESKVLYDSALNNERVRLGRGVYSGIVNGTNSSNESMATTTVAARQQSQGIPLPVQKHSSFSAGYSLVQAVLSYYLQPLRHSMMMNDDHTVVGGYNGSTTTLEDTIAATIIHHKHLLKLWDFVGAEQYIMNAINNVACLPQDKDIPNTTLAPIVTTSNATPSHQHHDAVSGVENSSSASSITNNVMTSSNNTVEKYEELLNSSSYVSTIAKYMYKSALFARLMLPYRYIPNIQVDIYQLKEIVSTNTKTSIFKGNSNSSSNSNTHHVGAGGAVGSGVHNNTSNKDPIIVPNTSAHSSSIEVFGTIKLIKHTGRKVEVAMQNANNKTLSIDGTMLTSTYKAEINTKHTNLGNYSHLQTMHVSYNTAQSSMPVTTTTITTINQTVDYTYREQCIFRYALPEGMLSPYLPYYNPLFPTTTNNNSSDNNTTAVKSQNNLNNNMINKQLHTVPSKIVITLYERNFFSDTKLGEVEIPLLQLTDKKVIKDWFPVRNDRNISWIVYLQIRLKFQLMSMDLNYGTGHNHKNSKTTSANMDYDNIGKNSISKHDGKMIPPFHSLHVNMKSMSPMIDKMKQRVSPSMIFHNKGNSKNNNNITNADYISSASATSSSVSSSNNKRSLLGQLDEFF